MVWRGCPAVRRSAGGPRQDLTLIGFGLAVPDVGFASVVSGPSAYYDDPDRTAAMLRTFQRLSELALSPADTKNAINRKMKEFRQ